MITDCEFLIRDNKSGLENFSLMIFTFHMSSVHRTWFCNALSQRPHLCVMAEISKDWRYLTLAEYARDQWVFGIIDGSIHDSKYNLVNELIIYKGRI